MSTLSVEDYPALIDGERVPAEEYFEDLDPSTGQVIARVSRCGAEEVDRAVKAARRTYEQTWRRTTPAERARVLRRISDLVGQNIGALARLECIDTGKPLRQAHIDASNTARYFEFYADTIEALLGETVPAVRDVFIYTLREPYGVTAHIVPWNYPLQIGARTTAPSLAVGNCCVLKPAEEAPLSLLRLAELCLEAGLPAGALNVVPGLGEEAGAALACHPGVDHLSFTGSVEVGRLVGAAAAQNTIPLTLELGGKSPNIVLEDADLERAVPTIVNSITAMAGQTCTAGSRLLVHQSLHRQVVDRVSERFATLRIGRGIDNPDLGPLISEKQRMRVLDFIERARPHSRLVYGGGLPASPDGGFFVEPTLFDDVDPDAELNQEEVFGPVMATTPFSDLDEAVELANGTGYGLVAAIWTRDVGIAHRLARDVRAGQIFINTFSSGGVELPFGGYKGSGHGREKGFEALRTFSQIKTVGVQIQD